mmetsp:Transcript_27659/g.74960  ORF Transcript_27659/g.74960 Transcript_27659/m.74960 type:complete len:388 (+) Transcript_27659:906-2069(+)
MALLLQRGDPLEQLSRVLIPLLHAVRLLCLLEEAQVPDTGRDAAQLLDRAPHPPAAQVLEVAGGHNRGDTLHALHHAKNALGDGVVAGALERAQQPPEARLHVPRRREARGADGLQQGPLRRQLQGLLRALPGLSLGTFEESLNGADNASSCLDRGCALSNRPCLVQDHSVQPRRGLQGGSALHETAALGGHACSDHHSHGRCQAHRAGTSDHEDGHAKLHRKQKLQRALHILVGCVHRHMHRHSLGMACVEARWHLHNVTEDQDCPYREGDHGQGDHAGDEHPRYSVGDPLHACLGGLRLLNQAAHLPQRRVTAHLGNTHQAPSRYARRPAHHDVALFLRHCPALTSEEALVHVHRCLRAHDAVHWDRCPGEDAKDVAELYELDGH